MPKEITHLIIARNVLNRLKASGPITLAEMIKRHEKAFYLGSIIPDAYFYYLLPSPRIPATLPTVTKVLHVKDRLKNMEVTENLLRAATAETNAPSMKAAFCAGMITHTASDGLFHEIIDYYCRQREETGSRSLGTHRQLETLFDEVFLKLSGETLHDFPLEESVSVSPVESLCLLRFSVSMLAPPPPAFYGKIIRAFRRAHAQQLFLLKLFKKAHAFRAARLAHKMTAGRSESISALFYPPAISRKNFPVLERFDVNIMTNGKDFEGDLAALNQQVLDQAVGCIQSGFVRSGEKRRSDQNHQPAC